LIFPFDFQLLRPELRHPQEILRRHAEAHGVDVIDFTDRFRDAIYDAPELLACFAERGLGPEEVQRLYRWKIAEYFLDADHFTEKGHRLGAGAQLEYLEARDLVGGAPAP